VRGDWSTRVIGIVSRETDASFQVWR